MKGLCTYLQELKKLGGYAVSQTKLVFVSMHGKRRYATWLDALLLSSDGIEGIITDHAACCCDPIAVASVHEHDQGTIAPPALVLQYTGVSLMQCR